MTCRDLHSALARPELVRQLDLRRQGLHSIADVPWERFTQLSSLDLSDNQLRFLPKRMQALTGLRSLFLGKNRFSSLPDWLPELRSLRQLSASRNRLHDLPELPAELEILDLQQNKLKDVPPAVLACPRLLNLYLGKNPFQEITATLTGLTQLRILDLSHCGLHHLPALPVTLSRLDAPHNKLETLASNWTQLARLEKIDLAHNPIVLATEDFVHFPGLRFLHINKTGARIDVPLLLEKCPRLENLVGGTRTEAQALFAAQFVQSVVRLPAYLSRRQLWDIWHGAPPEQLPLADLWQLLQPAFPLNIRFPAAVALLRGYRASAGDIPRQTWRLIGETATPADALTERLARHGIRTSTDDSAYCLLGHRWPEGITLPVGARLLTERQLVHYLDRREGRSLTFSTDEDLIQNLRKIQTTAAQPLLPWLHFLQTSGVPDLVLAELLAQSLRATVSERTAILATIQPYLPWAVQLTLTEVLSAKHGSREVFPKVPGGSLRERLMRVVRDGIK